MIDAGEIKKLAETYLPYDRPYTISPLTTALGCRHVDLGEMTWRADSPVQPSFKDEALVSAILVQALRSHMCATVYRPPEDGFAILDGLSRNERWRYCLRSIDDTYYLGALLAYMTIDKIEGCTSIFCGVVNAWLKPPTPWMSYPPAQVFITAMFGQAWPAIALQNDISRQWNIGSIILKERPPFVAGLSSAQDADLSTSLPGLEAILEL
jgi:hypothetical protein